MNDDDIKNRFFKSLRPLRRKMFIEKLLTFGLFGVALGFFIDAVIIYMSKIVYFENVYWFVVLAIAISFIISLFFVIFTRPNNYDAAKAGDRLGFDERFVTAYELLTTNLQNTRLSMLAISDAIEKAERANLSKLYVLRITKKAIIIFSSFLFVFILAGLIPAPSQAEQKLKTRQELADKINTELKKIEQYKKENTAGLNEIQKKEIDEVLKNLIDQLKKADDKTEAVKSIEKAQESLKSLEKENTDLKHLSEKLSQTEQTKGLAEAIDNKDEKAVEKELAALMDKLENASESELSELSKLLNKMAESISEQELSSALEKLAESAENGSGSIAENSGDLQSALQSALQNAQSQNSELNEAVSKMNSALSQSGKTIQGQRSSTSQTDNQGSEQGEGQGSGQGQGEGQGNGQGQGEGQGSGQGQGEGQGSGQGQGRGTGHIESENIYSREAQNAAGYDAFIDGIENETENIIETEQKGIGEAGESIPYRNVYEQYRDEALRALDTDEIPYGVRELVKDYFSSLE